VSTIREKPWGKWVAAVAGVLLLLKSTAYVVARLFGFAKHEVQARGGDVAFVLGVAERRKGTRS
jgi:hypothetical protein